MNNKYCNILSDLHNNRKSAVLTAHGFTEPHLVQDGLDQGETHAPILWRIFYDPLLCAVNELNGTTGYAMVAISNRMSPTINHLAFVDDTLWIANSQHAMEAILTKAHSFFLRNDIQINIQKTEALLALGKKLSNDFDLIKRLLRFGEGIVVPSNPFIPHRYLGIWISGDNEPKHTTRKLLQEIDYICHTASRKPLTDKTIGYIIRSVAHPIIEYRTKGLYMDKPSCNKLNGKLKSLFRKSANLSRETGSKTIHYPDFYDIPTVADIQLRARVTEYINDSNSQNIEGKFTRHRTAQFQWSRWLRLSPLATPEAIHSRNPFKLLTGINNDLLSINCAIFDAEGLQWKRPTPQRHFLEERATIKDSLGPFFNYQRAISILRKLDILYTDQLFDSSKKLLTISAIRKKANLNLKGRKPAWYHQLTTNTDSNGHLRINAFPPERNKHNLKWMKSTEVVQEIIRIPRTLRFFEAARNYCLEIDPDSLSEWMNVKTQLENTPYATLSFYTNGSLNKEGPPPIKNALQSISIFYV